MYEELSLDETIGYLKKCIESLEKIGNDITAKKIIETIYGKDMSNKFIITLNDINKDVIKSSIMRLNNILNVIQL